MGAYEWAHKDTYMIHSKEIERSLFFPSIRGKNANETKLTKKKKDKIYFVFRLYTKLNRMAVAQNWLTLSSPQYTQFQVNNAQRIT